MNFEQKSFTPSLHIGDKGNECRSTLYDKPKKLDEIDEELKEAELKETNEKE